MARGIRSFDFSNDGTVSRHDIRLDSAGNLATVEGLDEIKDRVSCSVLLYRGEDVWDETFGIDYTTLAELSPIDRSHIPAAILSHVLARPGVNTAEITLERLDAETRDLRIEVRIDTDEGTTTIAT